MRRSTRLMLMQEGNRSETRSGGTEYSPERDGRRAIGFYTDNRYDDNYDRAESRRRRDSRGRFAEYPSEESTRMRNDGYSGYDGSKNAMPYWQDTPNMHAGRTIRGSGSFEMEYPQQGHARNYNGKNGDMSQPIDERTARMWVQRMDGGEHFPMQHTEEMRKNVCARCNPYAFYVAMNMMYSDYSDVARQMDMDKPEYYANMAKAFIEDTDAKDHKLRRYMENVAG